ncbi:sulfatase-like hydrolase/transferase [Pseudoalteromonas sp. bablab_jr010]|uniref:sulfatase-like hydrolase/transferase n=1 Tax=Pseudoalteromonas sp. bablab_jr010 TaxID=2755063 RepID=UPI0018F3D94C|nr:sulfatase-like hydrolase/transferase [Pseudoalteromonas sp. bablab_jr010]|tara:strand:+ start:1288 stop:2415 length:1128 start_codon:yes stop_codon:yes gene_type:complete
MKKLILATAVVAASLLSLNSKAADNVVLVTLDGLRWQEVFSGADKNLINNTDFVADTDELKALFWRDDQAQRTQALMPFFSETLAKQGVLIGDRTQGSLMSVSNPWYFSYPGYSEILTGMVDENIDSNDKVPNPNKTILESLNTQPEFKGKTALFGSWDVFPYIVNRERSGVYVNAGFEAFDAVKSNEVTLLNQMQSEIPSPWHNVRLDSFTYRFAKQYLLNKQPRLLVISLGETDDFAHNGKYDAYLKSAKQSDAFIRDLWQTIQQTPGYKDNTTLIITTDHGRGSHADDWQHHSSKRALARSEQGKQRFPNGIVGSEHIWLAAIGPDIKTKGLIKPKNELKQAQVAATVLSVLGINSQQVNPKMAAPIKEILK